MAVPDLADIKNKKRQLPQARSAFWKQTTRYLPKLDLIAIQKESYQDFLNEGINRLLSEISPIEDFTGKNWELTLGELSLDEAKYTPLQAAQKGVSFENPLKVKATLLNQKTGRRGFIFIISFGNGPT